MEYTITQLKSAFAKIDFKAALLLMLLCGLSMKGQTIQVNTVAPNPVCGGQLVTLTFTATNGNGNNKHYKDTTVFSAYLSTNTGAAPFTLLGTVALQPYTFQGGNGVVNANVEGTILLPVTASGAYKIAVGSTGPDFDASTGAGASSDFTVNAAPTGGAISGSATVCPGTNSTLLTLSGYTGSIVKWQSSTVSDFSSGVVDISNTSASYTAVNISVSTYYRAVLTNGTCQSNSGVGTVTVNPNAGTAASNQSICSGTQPANIVLSGSTGTIQWQSSTDNVVFNAITGATAATLTSAQMGNLTVTTYYRAMVTGGCGTVNSNVVTVTVSPPSVGGTVASDATVCSGNNSTVLTLSGHTGTVIKWQSSTQPNFNSPTDIANTTTTLTVVDLVSTTYYRAVVQNGGCAVANSANVKITVQNGPMGGTLSGSATVCYGANITNLTLTGYSNTIQKWQSSPVSDFSSGVVDIANTTANLTVSNLTATTYYRVVVVNMNCTAFSTVATITVNPMLVTSISGTNSPVCSGNDAVFNLTGTSGATVTYNINGGSNQTVVLTGGTAAVTVTGASSDQTLNLVSVVLSGCSQTLSGSSTVTVNPAPVASINGNNSPVCSGNDAVFNLTGTSGATVTYNINGGSNQTVVLTGGTAAVTVTGVSSDQTLNLVSVALSGCSQALSASSTVTITSSLFVSISSNNSPVCTGNTAIFNLTGSSGATVTYNINGGSNQTVVLTGGTASVTVAGATSNQTLNLISISLSGCSQALTGSSTVTVNAVNSWTGAVDTNWNQSGNWSCGTVPNANSSVIINSATVVVSSANAFANTVSLNGTASLTVNSGYNITLTNNMAVASGASMVLQNNANLLQINNAPNIGNITVYRNSSALMRLDYTLWSSPVASQNLLAFSPLTVATRFYVYNSATNVYSAITPSSNSFQTAKGYLIRMPDNHPTTPTKWGGVFSGVPNNGNISFSAYNGGSGFGYNAIGNPYPSPVDLNSFVNGNSGNITGTLYFWRKTNSATTEPGYCTWTTAGFVSNGEAQVVNPNGILRTGQGFLVEMSGSATTVSFTNSMRAADNADQFFRSTAGRDLTGDRIWLNVDSTSGANNQMLLGYFNSATLGVDYGIDGKTIEDAPVSLTMDINGGNYIIQGRPAFVNTDVVPLRFKTSYSGAHSIAIDHVDGVFSGTQNIYLRDNLLSVVHDLKAAPYSFTSAAGTFTNRFEVFYDTTLGVGSGNAYANTVVVYKNSPTSLAISAKNITIADVKIYDLQGRAIQGQSDINASEIVISNLNLANQILLLEIKTTEGVVIHKKIPF
ncbi:beta strand repeat-containing protein [Flavobacterium pedocola]